MNKYHLAESQTLNLEETYLDVFGYKTNGVFVEIGAFNGISWSNTYGLAKIGWSGLLIEPQKNKLDECKKNYAGFKDILFVESCVGSFTGLTKFWNGGSGSLGTCKEEMIDIYESIESLSGRLKKDSFSEVSIDTLDNILTKSKISREIDVISIDAEGSELDILKGFNINKYKPKLVIIEMHEMLKEEKLHIDNDLIDKYFFEASYKKIYKGEINTIFIR
jgi:FkbM family methyltransferase